MPFKPREASWSAPVLWRFEMRAAIIKTHEELANGIISKVRL